MTTTIHLRRGDISAGSSGTARAATSDLSSSISEIPLKVDDVNYGIAKEFVEIKRQEITDENVVNDRNKKSEVLILTGVLSPTPTQITAGIHWFHFLKDMEWVSKNWYYSSSHPAYGNHPYVYWDKTILGGVAISDIATADCTYRGPIEKFEVHWIVPDGAPEYTLSIRRGDKRS